MGKKPIVKLRAYRGTKLSYNADGTVQNENNLISVEHGSRIWDLHLKNFKISSFCKVEVENVYVDKAEGWVVDNAKKDKIQSEVKDAMDLNKDIAKTPEQIRIAELEAKLEAFMNATQNKDIAKESKKETKEVSIEVSLEDLQKQYQDKFDKKPHHMWKREKILEKLKE